MSLRPSLRLGGSGTRVGGRGVLERPNTGELLEAGSRTVEGAGARPDTRAWVCAGPE